MRKMLIALFALTIGMGSVMADSNISLEDEKEEKKRKKGKDETLFDTFRRNASKAIGRPLKGTIGGSSENHLLTKEKIDENRKGAVDISTRANKLTKEEYRKIGKVALSLGLRVGNEGDHLHIDDNIKDKKGKTLNRVFTRKQGTKEDDAYFKSLKEEDMDTFENDPVIKAKSSMFDNRVLNNRSPHSIQDSVNIQDSSIKKEETMINKPLGKSIEEEEELLDVSNPIDRLNVKRQSQEVATRLRGRTEEEEEESRSKLKEFLDLTKRDAPLAALKYGMESPKFQELSRIEQDQAVEDAKDTNKLMEGSTQSQKDKSEGKQGSVKNEFLEAITYFLPSIAGLAIGGAIGGEAGAAEGAQLGMKAGESYYQAKERERERELKYGPQGQMRGRKFQQTEYTDKDGNPITYDPVANKHIKADGTEATADDFQNSKDARQARRLERTDKSLLLSEMKVKHSISKDTQLSDKQVDAFTAMKKVESGLDRIEKLKKDVATGLGIKQFRDAQELFNAAPKKYSELKAEAASVLADYINAISGKQVSDKEAERLKALIPSPEDAPRTFDAKMKAFKRITSSSYRALRGTILKGQPLKEGSLKNFDEELFKVQQIQEEEEEKKPAKSSISIQRQLEIIKKIKSGGNK